MKKYLSLFLSVTLFLGAGTLYVQAASLSSSQISAILSLLQSFNASASVLANVQASLTGQSVASTISASAPVSYSNGCVALSSDLSSGSSNSAVSALQSFLTNQGYLTSTPTGYFGSSTVTAVEGFQGAQGISNTGYVGPLTRARIQALSCPNGVPAAQGIVKAVSTSAVAQNATPASCSSDFSPVCGKDGRTYNNSCFAQQDGVSVVAIGACGSHATYQAPSLVCAAEAVSPVCGSNGITYANTCLANLNNIQVQYSGACPEKSSLIFGPDVAPTTTSAVVVPVVSTPTTTDDSNSCAGTIDSVTGACILPECQYDGEANCVSCPPNQSYEFSTGQCVEAL